MSTVKHGLQRLEQGNGGAPVIYIVAVDPDGRQGPPFKARAMPPDAFDYLAAIAPIVQPQEGIDEHRETH